MRVVHWNIQHGGGPTRTPEIALALLDYRADVVVLTEFRRERGGQIAGVLHDHGLRFQANSHPPPRTNGVLIASREPLHVIPPPADRDIATRRVDVHLPDSALWITGVHVPDAAKHDAPAIVRKAAHFRALIEFSREKAGERHVITGDLNTGRHRLDEPGETFTCTALLGQLATFGYADAYRALHPTGRDASWQSHIGQGFRLDHTLVSSALSGGVREAWYDENPRDSKHSDHAPMIVELDLADDGGRIKTVRA
ncbi:MAG: endonuclease/exonuclease/phosphatase family protein [Phycisphaerales bacterium]